MKVVKFGGSSLASATQFKKVHDIVLEDTDRHYVVPSAPGKRNKEDTKVTDLLILAYSHHNKDDFEEIYDRIKERYNEIITELGLDISLEEDFKEIKEEIKKQNSFDYTISRGEYLNGKVLANYLGFDFIDAADVIYIDKHGRYDEKKTDAALTKALSEHDYAVVPGFYGQLNDESGRIKAFSRGGSDVTGSIVAKCACADLYENWTDVSGFLIADPRIVKDPKPIATITYKELRELSYMGASVLHEDAIFPVRAAGIPINIKNTNRPEDKGTFIVQDIDDKECKTITGIAGKKDFTVISIEKAMMNSELGFCRKLLSVLETNNISFENMPSGIDTVCVVISDSELKHKRDKIVEEIKRACNPDSIVVHPNMALIATVGKRMAKQKGVAAKVFSALSEANVNIRMIDQGSSEMNILVGIENDDFERGIQAIYNAFN